VGSVFGSLLTTADMVRFDASGNVLGYASGYLPQMATADGSAIGVPYQGVSDATGGVIPGPAGTFDANLNVTGQMPSLPIQSWTGSAYQYGSIDQVASRTIFVDGASFWPQIGGNPSGNGTGILQCPCLLQTAAATATSVPSTGVQKTYLIVSGDPGLNLGNGHNHNVGGLFDLAAQTQAENLTGSGNSTVITQRVSSVSDLNTALTNSGTINGTVTYFGHAGIDGHGNYALFPGQNPGDNNNVSVLNVNQLSNSKLAPTVTITLNACHARLGGSNSIAKAIARQLKRTVYAYPVDMYFSSNPSPKRFVKGMKAPSGVPTYMVPNGDGLQPIPFTP
jgi:hypothetical protein